MILSRHTIICDGCGLAGPSSDHTAVPAQLRARADQWTLDEHPNLIVARKHWCPDCTRARKEARDDRA